MGTLQITGLSMEEIQRFNVLKAEKKLTSAMLFREIFAGYSQGTSNTVQEVAPQVA